MAGHIVAKGAGRRQIWSGATGGINGKVDAVTGNKTVEFKSISLENGKLTVNFEAGEVNANGQKFGLVCKENLMDTTTFTIEVTLENGASQDLGTLQGLTDRPSLFIVGIIGLQNP